MLQGGRGGGGGSGSGEVNDGVERTRECEAAGKVELAEGVGTQSVQRDCSSDILAYQMR